MGAKKKQPQIVVTVPMGFSPDQIKRLRLLGRVTLYSDSPKSPKDWVDRCGDADIVCSGKYGLKEKIYQTNNIFYSLPFVAVGWIDKEKLKENNITVSYCPGCNKHAVSEWIIAMMLILLRRFDELINVKKLVEKDTSHKFLGLMGKKVCILGKGNIGSRVDAVSKALDMKVSYVQRGSNLFERVKDSDIIVNTLSTNPSTINLLDKNFFNSLKKGSYFITVIGFKIYDTKAMLNALDKGILAGVADDAGGILPCNYQDPYYKQLIRHPRVIATPHFSYHSDVSLRVSNDMMIDNIEAWIKGKLINVVN